MIQSTLYLSTTAKAVFCTSYKGFNMNKPKPAALPFMHSCMQFISRTRLQPSEGNKWSSIPCTFMNATLAVKRIGAEGTTNGGSSARFGLQTNFGRQSRQHPTSNPSAVSASSLPHATCKVAPTKAQLFLMFWSFRSKATMNITVLFQLTANTPAHSSFWQRSAAQQEADPDPNVESQIWLLQQFFSSFSDLNKYVRQCGMWHPIWRVWSKSFFWGQSFEGLAFQYEMSYGIFRFAKWQWALCRIFVPKGSHNTNSLSYLCLSLYEGPRFRSTRQLVLRCIQLWMVYLSKGSEQLRGKRD